MEALLAWREGQLDHAEATAQLARRLVNRSDLAEDWWIAPIDEILGLIAADRAQWEGAETRLRHALVLKRRTFGERRPAAMAMLTLGRLHVASGRTGEALTTMRRAIDIILHETPKGVGLPFDQVASFLDAALALAATTADPAEAEALRQEMFEVAQLVHQSGTAKAVARTIARLSSGDSAAAQAIRSAHEMAWRRDRLRLALGREAVKPAEQRDPARLAHLRLAFTQADRASARLNAEIEALRPGYGQLASTRSASAETVRSVLAADEALVYLLSGPEAAYGLLLEGGSKSLEVARLGVSGEALDTRIAALRAAFQISAGRIGTFPADLSHRLYRDLLGPWDQKLDQVRHLIVIPTGALLSLPPALLVRREPSEVEAVAASCLDELGLYQALPWLGRDMAVSIAPSVQSFADMRRLVRPSRAPLPLLGFGDPPFQGTALAVADADADKKAVGKAVGETGGVPQRQGQGQGQGLARLTQTCRQAEPVDPALLRRLAPLPGTAAELRQVAAILEADSRSLYLGAQASEPALRRTALDRYRVLYFATHGLLPGELACQSEPALVLAPPATHPPDRLRDGLLDASEIAGLTLDADLVVLSACNTGAGGGEALSGLARAFFYAGSRALITSHWQVDSEATTRLMVGVFQHRQQHPDLGYAEAIRQAQQALIARRATAHPFFWAAFTLVGDGRAGTGEAGADSQGPI